MLRNPTLPTPVQPDALKRQLHEYREDLLITLLNGFTFGFRLGYEGSHHHYDHISSSNHKSVRENRDIVESKLQKELTWEGYTVLFQNYLSLTVPFLLLALFLSLFQGNTDLYMTFLILVGHRSMLVFWIFIVPFIMIL